jgi:hypothetical protein
LPKEISTQSDKSTNHLGKSVQRGTPLQVSAKYFLYHAFL